MKTYKLVISILITLLSFSAALYSQSPQWTVQHSGLPNTLNPTLALSAVDSNVCWGLGGPGAPKCVLTTNGGVNWTLMDIQGIPGFVAASIAGISASTAYIALNDTTLATSGGIFKTTDGGLNWIKQSSAFPGAGGHPATIYFFDANNGICTGWPRNGYWEIYTTSDGGTNWTRVPSANIPAPETGDFGGGGKGSGTNFWFNSGSCSVYHTTDRGLTWSVSRNIYPAPAFFIELAFKDSLNGLVVSYFGDQINKASKTTDGGASWTRLNTPMSPPSSYFINYVPGTSGTYVVTSAKNIGSNEPTASGSIFTLDGGVTWNPIDKLAHGPSAFVNNKIGWSPGSGDTIFKWSGYPLGINPQNPLNKTVMLYQNYPNPFSSSTSISYQVPASSKVILKVFDVQGSEVATLVNGEKSAGSYKVKFESNGLSSGIYYYRLQVGESMETKKLCIF
jgi:photosystem II stability/assembly factor-like uncharacterized protein